MKKLKVLVEMEKNNNATLSCKVCNLTFVSVQERSEHDFSLTHHIKSDKMKKGIPHYCSLCGVFVGSLKNYAAHLTGKKHKTCLKKKLESEKVNVKEKKVNVKEKKVNVKEKKDDRPASKELVNKNLLVNTFTVSVKQNSSENLQNSDKNNAQITEVNMKNSGQSSCSEPKIHTSADSFIQNDNYYDDYLPYNAPFYEDDFVMQQQPLFPQSPSIPPPIEHLYQFRMQWRNSNMPTNNFLLPYNQFKHTPRGYFNQASSWCQANRGRNSQKYNNSGIEIGYSHVAYSNSSSEPQCYSPGYHSFTKQNKWNESNNYTKGQSNFSRMSKDIKNAKSNNQCTSFTSSPQAVKKGPMEFESHSKENMCDGKKIADTGDENGKSISRQNEKNSFLRSNLKSCPRTMREQQRNIKSEQSRIIRQALQSKHSKVKPVCMHLKNIYKKQTFKSCEDSNITRNGNSRSSTEKCSLQSSNEAKLESENNKVKDKVPEQPKTCNQNLSNVKSQILQKEEKNINQTPTRRRVNSESGSIINGIHSPVHLVSSPFKPQSHLIFLSSDSGDDEEEDIKKLEKIANRGKKNVYSIVKESSSNQNSNLSASSSDEQDSRSNDFYRLAKILANSNNQISAYNKKLLHRFVNNPCSRKEQLKLEKWIQEYTKTQKKMMLPRFNMQLGPSEMTKDTGLSAEEDTLLKSFASAVDGFPEDVLSSLVDVFGNNNPQKTDYSEHLCENNESVTMSKMYQISYKQTSKSSMETSTINKPENCESDNTSKMCQQIDEVQVNNSSMETSNVKCLKKYGCDVKSKMPQKISETRTDSSNIKTDNISNLKKQSGKRKKSTEITLKKKIEKRKKTIKENESPNGSINEIHSENNTNYVNNDHHQTSQMEKLSSDQAACVDNNSCTTSIVGPLNHDRAACVDNNSCTTSVMGPLNRDQAACVDNNSCTTSIMGPLNKYTDGVVDTPRSPDKLRRPSNNKSPLTTNVRSSCSGQAPGGVPKKPDNKSCTASDEVQLGDLQPLQSMQRNTDNESSSTAGVASLNTKIFVCVTDPCTNVSLQKMPVSDSTAITIKQEPPDDIAGCSESIVHHVDESTGNSSSTIMTPTTVNNVQGCLIADRNISPSVDVQKNSDLSFNSNHDNSSSPSSKLTDTQRTSIALECDMLNRLCGISQVKKEPISFNQESVENSSCHISSYNPTKEAYKSFSPTDVHGTLPLPQDDQGFCEIINIKKEPGSLPQEEMISSSHDALPHSSSKSDVNSICSAQTSQSTIEAELHNVIKENVAQKSGQENCAQVTLQDEQFPVSSSGSSPSNKPPRIDTAIISAESQSSHSAEPSGSSVTDKDQNECHKHSKEHSVTTSSKPKLQEQGQSSSSGPHDLVQALLMLSKKEDDLRQHSKRVEDVVCQLTTMLEDWKRKRLQILHEEEQLRAKRMKLLQILEGSFKEETQVENSTRCEESSKSHHDTSEQLENQSPTTSSQSTLGVADVGSQSFPNVTLTKCGDDYNVGQDIIENVSDSTELDASINVQYLGTLDDITLDTIHQLAKCFPPFDCPCPLEDCKLNRSRMNLSPSVSEHQPESSSNVVKEKNATKKTSNLSDVASGKSDGEVQICPNNNVKKKQKRLSPCGETNPLNSKLSSKLSSSENGCPSSKKVKRATAKTSQTERSKSKKGNANNIGIVDTVYGIPDTMLIKAASQNGRDSLPSLQQDDSLTATGINIEKLIAHRSAITDIKVYNGYLYTCSSDKTAKRFNLQNPEEQLVYRKHQKTVSALFVTTVMSGICVFTTCHDGYLRCFEAKSAKFLHEVNMNTSILCMAHGWDKLFLGLQTGQIAILNLMTSTVLDYVQCSYSSISRIAPATQGAQRLLCIASYDGVMTIWDASTKLLIRCLSGQVKPPTFIRIADNYVYATTTDHSLLIHDLSSGVLETFTNWPSSATGLHLFNDYILTCAFDGLVRCYNRKDLTLHSMYYGAGKSMVMCMDVYQGWVFTANRRGLVQAFKFDAKHVEKCLFDKCSLKFGCQEDLSHHIIIDHGPSPGPSSKKAKP